MPNKRALIIFDKCNPEKCDRGVCAAALACPRKLLQQDAPFEVPLPNPSVCKGCGDCARACPLKAIEIGRG